MNHELVPIAIVIVLYNICCQDSPTCRAVMQGKQENVTVLIYDNSEKENNNHSECRRLGWVYLGGQGNRGISAAYNTCLDRLERDAFSGLVCLFDDDTYIEPQYFDAVRKAFENDPNAISVPVIHSGNTILSPCLIDANYRTTRFADEKFLYSYHGNKLSAINSGMAIPFSVFKNYRYDRNIFLDGVDHKFLFDMKKNKVSLQIMNYSCRHDFSGDGKPSLKTAVFRFRIFAKDYAYILKKQPLAYAMLVGRRAIHLSFIYQTPEFMKISWCSKPAKS